MSASKAIPLWTLLHDGGGFSRGAGGAPNRVITQYVEAGEVSYPDRVGARVGSEWVAMGAPAADRSGFRVRPSACAQSPDRLPLGPALGI